MGLVNISLDFSGPENNKAIMQKKKLQTPIDHHHGHGEEKEEAEERMKYRRLGI